MNEKAATRLTGETPEADARRRDGRDELAAFREQFHHAPGQIYLDGNSLGLLSRPAEASLLRVLEQWKALGVGGWTEADPPWFFLAEELARLTAPLVGARPDEVIVANSTTVNLHQLVATLFRPHERRTKILADELAFPSDVHALHSQLALRGLDPAGHLVRVRSRDGLTLAEADIVEAMTDEIALAVLPSVLYASGQLLDMAYLTEQAHRRGIVIGFDCSHSAGAVPHELGKWGADFAVWCGYKYLNGGPGAAGGLYLNARHRDKAPGLAGWFGSRKETQFAMAHAHDPAPGAGGLQIGTPNVLSMAPLLGSLSMFADAGPDRLRRKSLEMTAFLRAFVEERMAHHGFTVATPREDRRRGGHLALRHPDAARICRALRGAGVVPDHRQPDLIRLAPVPLYTSFADCCEALRRLETIMDTRRYEEHAPEPGLVP